MRQSSHAQGDDLRRVDRASAPEADDAVDAGTARVLDRLFDLGDWRVLRDRRRHVRFERQGGAHQRLRRHQREASDAEALELARQLLYGACAPMDDRRVRVPESRHRRNCRQ